MGTYLSVIFPTLTFAVGLITGLHRRVDMHCMDTEYGQGWLLGADLKRASVVVGVAK